jgi:3-deoxy-D-manno-octulosonate 8-phosphate phosphatase (KDO 8-P phosphatase)
MHFDLEPRQVCYVGDDLVDLPVLRAAGLAAAPADAVAEVREAAHLVTAAPGGRGAVREVIERILRAQGLWHGLCQTYGAPAM